MGRVRYALYFVALGIIAWVFGPGRKEASPSPLASSPTPSSAEHTPTRSVDFSRLPVTVAVASAVPASRGTPDCNAVGPDDLTCAQVESVVRNAPLDDDDGEEVGPPAPNAEAHPLGTAFAAFADKLGEHFAHMDAKPPSQAHALLYSMYGDQMGTRLQLVGPRDRLETASLSLFDRIDASTPALTKQASIVERFVEAALPGVDAREVVAFVNSERLPARDDGLSLRSKTWEQSGKKLTVVCNDNYGSVDLHAGNPGAIGTM